MLFDRPVIQVHLASRQGVELHCGMVHGAKQRVVHSVSSGINVGRKAFHCNGKVVAQRTIAAKDLLAEGAASGNTTPFSKGSVLVSDDNASPIISTAFTIRLRALWDEEDENTETKNADILLFAVTKTQQLRKSDPNEEVRFWIEVHGGLANKHVLHDVTVYLGQNEGCCMIAALIRDDICKTRWKVTNVLTTMPQHQLDWKLWLPSGATAPDVPNIPESIADVPASRTQSGTVSRKNSVDHDESLHGLAYVNSSRRGSMDSMTSKKSIAQDVVFTEVPIENSFALMRESANGPAFNRNLTAGNSNVQNKNGNSTQNIMNRAPSQKKLQTSKSTILNIVDERAKFEKNSSDDSFADEDTQRRKPNSLPNRKEENKEKDMREQESGTRTPDLINASSSTNNGNLRPGAVSAQGGNSPRSRHIVDVQTWVRSHSSSAKPRKKIHVNKLPKNSDDDCESVVESVGAVSSAAVSQFSTSYYQASEEMPMSMVSRISYLPQTKFTDSRKSSRRNSPAVCMHSNHGGNGRARWIGGGTNQNSVNGTTNANGLGNANGALSAAALNAGSNPFPTQSNVMSVPLTSGGTLSSSFSHAINNIATQMAGQGIFDTASQNGRAQGRPRGHSQDQDLTFSDFSDAGKEGARDFIITRQQRLIEKLETDLERERNNSKSREWKGAVDMLSEKFETVKEELQVLHEKVGDKFSPQLSQYPDSTKSSQYPDASKSTSRSAGSNRAVSSSAAVRLPDKNYMTKPTMLQKDISTRERPHPSVSSSSRPDYQKKPGNAYTKRKMIPSPRGLQDSPQDIYPAASPNIPSWSPASTTVGERNVYSLDCDNSSSWRQDDHSFSRDSVMNSQVFSNMVAKINYESDNARDMNLLDRKPPIGPAFGAPPEPFMRTYQHGRLQPNGSERNLSMPTKYEKGGRPNYEQGSGYHYGSNSAGKSSNGKDSMIALPQASPYLSSPATELAEKSETGNSVVRMASPGTSHSADAKSAVQLLDFDFPPNSTRETEKGSAIKVPPRPPPPTCAARVTPTRTPVLKPTSDTKSMQSLPNFTPHDASVIHYIPGRLPLNDATPLSTSRTQEERSETGATTGGGVVRVQPQGAILPTSQPPGMEKGGFTAGFRPSVRSTSNGFRPLGSSVQSVQTLLPTPQVSPLRPDAPPLLQGTILSGTQLDGTQLPPSSINETQLMATQFNRVHDRPAMKFRQAKPESPLFRRAPTPTKPAAVPPSRSSLTMAEPRSSLTMAASNRNEKVLAPNRDDNVFQTGYANSTPGSRRSLRDPGAGDASHKSSHASARHRLEEWSGQRPEVANSWSSSSSIRGSHEKPNSILRESHDSNARNLLNPRNSITSGTGGANNNSSTLENRIQRAFGPLKHDASKKYQTDTETKPGVRFSQLEAMFSEPDGISFLRDSKTESLLWPKVTKPGFSGVSAAMQEVAAERRRNNGRVVPNLNMAQVHQQQAARQRGNLPTGMVSNGGVSHGIRSSIDTAEAMRRNANRYGDENGCRNRGNATPAHSYPGGMSTPASSSGVNISLNTPAHPTPSSHGKKQVRYNEPASVLGTRDVNNGSNVHQQHHTSFTSNGHDMSWHSTSGRETSADTFGKPNRIADRQTMSLTQEYDQMRRENDKMGLN